MPFSLIQDRLKMASPKWSIWQDDWRSATGAYLPASRVFGRIYHPDTASLRRNYHVHPHVFFAFHSDVTNSREFLKHLPLNTNFRVYVVEAPNGGGGGGFPTFEEMLPHTRAGLQGKVDACGVLKVTDIILNGSTAPYNTWWPQRGIMRVINVLSELVGQIECGAPYEPAKAQRLAWRASARLPRPQPPFPTHRKGAAGTHSKTRVKGSC